MHLQNSIDNNYYSLTLLNLIPEVHMQPTLPPRLHIKLQSSTNTTLDQAPEPFPNIALISYYVFARSVLYFVYLILIFFLNYYFNSVL